MKLLGDWLELRLPSEVAALFASARIERGDLPPSESKDRCQKMIGEYLRPLNPGSDADAEKLVHLFAQVLVRQAEKESSPYYGAFDGLFGPPRAHEPSVSEFTEQLELDGLLRRVQGVMAPGSSVHMSHVARAAETLDAARIGAQIQRINNSVEREPDLAIGTAKELIETTCKTILDARGRKPDRGWSFPKLVKETMAGLPLAPETLDDEVQAAEAIRRLAGSLSGVVEGLARLRNLHGTGHGPSGGEVGLEPRHARLAAIAAAALATFLFQAHEASKGRGTR